MGRKLLVAVSLVLALVPATAAQASGGTAMGWGNNSEGQVGDGGTGGGPAPRAVTGLTEATAISGGYTFSLGLRVDGTVMAWGGNGAGQLGNGSMASSPSPIPVPGLANVVAVSAGTDQALALLADGTVMAWGSNVEGQLGDGATSGPETCPSVLACAKRPQRVPGITNAIAVATGYADDAALLADGTVLVWGSDRNGQLGDGVGVETGCSCVPTPTPVPGVRGAVALAAGFSHLAALLGDGTVATWGRDYEGQLGNGAAVRTTPPNCYCLGPLTVPGVSGARSIAGGGNFSAVLLQDGSTRAWGANEYGQLGGGSSSGPPCSCIPSAVAGPGPGLQGLAGGLYHALALRADGTVLGWGENEYGQLGEAGSSPRLTPIVVPGVSGASAVAGRVYTAFALIGPSQKLEVTLAGAGSGKVGGAAAAEGSEAIVCPGACAGRYPQGQVETLRAEANAGSGFAGFSGACTGTGLCRLTMSGDQAVTATFGPPKGTTITAAKIDRKKRSATFSFSAPGAITGFECKLVRPVPKHHRHKHRKHRHGAKFAACGSPQSYRHLKAAGSYQFQVRALDLLGADAQPASRGFKMKPIKKHRRHRHPGK